MSEMIERVARAIWEKHSCDYCVTSRDQPLPKDCCCYDAARATVSEIRIPTEAMVAAGLGTHMYGETYSSPDIVWPAMVDAALTE